MYGTAPQTEPLRTLIYDKSRVDEESWAAQEEQEVRGYVYVCTSMWVCLVAWITHIHHTHIHTYTCIYPFTQTNN